MAEPDCSPVFPDWRGQLPRSLAAAHDAIVRLLDDLADTGSILEKHESDLFGLTQAFSVDGQEADLRPFDQDRQSADGRYNALAEVARYATIDLPRAERALRAVEGEFIAAASGVARVTIGPLSQGDRSFLLGSEHHRSAASWHSLVWSVADTCFFHLMNEVVKGSGVEGDPAELRKHWCELTAADITRWIRDGDSDPWLKFVRGWADGLALSCDLPVLLVQELCRAADRRLVTRRRLPGDEVPLSAEEVETLTPPDECKRACNLRKALKFISEKGPVQALFVAREIEVAESTFRRYYEPELEKIGVRYEGEGYYLPNSQS